MARSDADHAGLGTGPGKQHAGPPGAVQEAAHPGGGSSVSASPVRSLAWPRGQARDLKEDTVKC